MQNRTHSKLLNYLSGCSVFYLLFNSFHCRNFAVSNSSIVLMSRYCCKLVVIKELFCNFTCTYYTYRSNKFPFKNLFISWHGGIPEYLNLCGNKMPTRCNRGFYCRSYWLLNMFRGPICPSSGAEEYYTVVAACGISCCGFQTIKSV